MVKWEVRLTAREATINPSCFYPVHAEPAPVPQLSAASWSPCDAAQVTAEESGGRLPLETDDKFNYLSLILNCKDVCIWLFSITWTVVPLEMTRLGNTRDFLCAFLRFPLNLAVIKRFFRATQSTIKSAAAGCSLLSRFWTKCEIARCSSSACEAKIMQISCTSSLDSRRCSNSPPHHCSQQRGLPKWEKVWKNSRVGVPSVVLHKQRTENWGKKKKEQRDKTGNFPTVVHFSQLLLLSAAMCTNFMDKLIKLIYKYQTLPFSTNESPQNTCSYSQWNVTQICSRPHRLLFVQRLSDREGHLNAVNKWHGPTNLPPLGSRRRRRLTVLESCTDPRGSITITIRQMRTYTSWLVRDSPNCLRPMVWSCTLCKEHWAVPRERRIHNKSSL